MTTNEIVRSDPNPYPKPYTQIRIPVVDEPRSAQ